jgi:iron(III) transport system permease protein
MLWGARSSRTLVITIAAAVFIACAVLPALYMLALPLSSLETFWESVQIVLLDARQRGLLSNTLLLGLGSATLATAIGLSLGFALARVPLPFKMALRLALLTPALLPPYVMALAWKSMGGVLNLAGAAIVLAFVLYPLPMLAAEVALRRVEPRLEEAALLVARPNRVFWRITARLAAPLILASALVVFVLATAEFAVPALLQVRVYATEVFTAFAAVYDFGRATVLALPLLILSVAVAGSAAALLGDRAVVTRRGSSAMTALAFESARNFWLIAAALTLLVALVGPMVVLMREAVPAESVIDVVRGSQDAVINSLWLAALGATLVTSLGICLGYARARASSRVGAALDVAWVVLFTVPSTVIGIGLIGVWNRSALGVFYGTAAMLVIGYLARYASLASLALGATIRSVPRSHEEAAATSGAGWILTMSRIVLPQIKLGLTAVWVIVFILAFGEIGTSILVAPAGESTLPIRVYTLIANAPPGHVETLALFQSIVIVLPLVLLAIVATRWAER